MSTCIHGFQLVVAVDQAGGIGNDSTLPWKISGDMSYFKKLTCHTHDPARQNAVIMGRVTWESLPAKFRPLPGRINIVLSRNALRPENIPEGVHVCGSLNAASELLDSDDLKRLVERAFVIGGAQVYADALTSPRTTVIHLTRIDHTYSCDTFFPTIDPQVFQLSSASEPITDKATEVRYSLICYSRSLHAISHPEAILS